MSLWYRAAQANDIEQTFSGDGGLYVAGRWHFKGRKVIYCSQSIALCTLEWLAHHGLSVSGFVYYKFSIDIPDELIIDFKVNDLPKNWSNNPATNHSREFAEKHLFNQTHYLAMSVPSVIIPEEKNLVINPAHSHFSKVQNSILALGKYTAPNR